MKTDIGNWMLIEIVPKTNEAPLILAEITEDSTVAVLDYDGYWRFTENGMGWQTRNGAVKEPTHWKYQPEWSLAEHDQA